jgi:hypothetical protein
LFETLIKKSNFNRNHTFLILWSNSDNLTATVFLYPKHHPEAEWSTGRNMLMKKVYIKIHHKIKAHVVVALYIL